MADNIHYFLLVGIMLVCGMLGGFANYWSDNITSDERHPILKRVSAGVAAAFVVPLFLNMISSSLLEDSRIKPLSLFIFAGFCIIASLSSKTFIESVTKKLLSKVERIGTDQKQLAQGVGPIIAKATEAPPKDWQNNYKLRAFGTDENAKKVIKALGTEKYAWRYLSGIVEETQLPREKIQSVLEWLESNDLATVMRGRHGQLWGLTIEGRGVFANTLAEEKTF